MVYQHIQSAYKMQFARGVPLTLMNDRHWSAPCNMCETPPHFHKQTTWTHVCVSVTLQNNRLTGGRSWWWRSHKFFYRRRRLWDSFSSGSDRSEQFSWRGGGGYFYRWSRDGFRSGFSDRMGRNGGRRRCEKLNSRRGGNRISKGRRSDGFRRRRRGNYFHRWRCCYKLSCGSRWSNGLTCRGWDSTHWFSWCCRYKGEVGGEWPALLVVEEVQ